MVTPTNNVIPAGFILCGDPVTWGIIATPFLPSIVEDEKKVLPFDRGAPGTVPYGKSGLGYCIMFLKKLNEDLM